MVQLHVLVRLSAMELIQGLLEEEELATPTHSALLSAITSHLDASSSDSDSSWKVKWCSKIALLVLVIYDCLGLCGWYGKVWLG